MSSKIESITATVPVTGIQSSRERRREIERRYWAKPENREKKRAKDKRYYERHKQKRLEAARVYIQAHPEQRKETCKRYYRNHIEEEAKRQVKYITNNLEKYKAHQMVRCAVLDGRLCPQKCEVCGNEKTSAHHEDYNKPLEVKWLCHKCHMALHAQKRKEKDAIKN